MVVGLLGCGVVGGGVAERLERGLFLNQEPAKLGRVLVRDLLKSRTPASVHTHLTANADDVIGDSRHRVIVECLGGVDPAHTYIDSALRRGVAVVTANKSLIAEHGESLLAVANEFGTQLAYEAAVGAAIPVLRTLRHLKASDDILEVGGVVNGTTNYVLSSMESGLSMDDAIAAAQEAGFAESDPSNDIDAVDAAQKLTILAATAFDTWLPWQSIPRRGIRDVSAEEIASARRRGSRIKLVAWTRYYRGEIMAAIGPTQLPLDHPFAMTRGAENIFLIVSKHAGPIVIGGLGAGREPTAAAVVGDLRDVLAKQVGAGATNHSYNTLQPTP